MGAYTITVMVRHPGQIIPESLEIRNVIEHMEKLLGGMVHVNSFDHPVPGVVTIVGPAGSDGSVVFAKDGGGHWEGLDLKDQKQIMAWHLKGGAMRNG